MKSLTLILTAALGLTGCGAATAERPRAATSAVTRPADTTRATCHRLSAVPEDDIDAQFDPLTWRPVAQAALTAKDPGVSAAGAKLRALVAANEQLSEQERRGDPNVALWNATLKLAQACINLYGDGPW